MIKIRSKFFRISGYIVYGLSMVLLIATGILALPAFAVGFIASVSRTNAYRLWGKQDFSDTMGKNTWLV